jgi:hypothetical protein
MNSLIQIDVYSETTRMRVSRIAIDDIISENEDINGIEYFFTPDQDLATSTSRLNGLDSDLLIDQYFSRYGNAADEYTTIWIRQLNPEDLILFNDLFSSQPTPYVIGDCRSFIVDDTVVGLIAPVAGFQFDEEYEDEDDLGPLPDHIPELIRNQPRRELLEDIPLQPQTQEERGRMKQEIDESMARAAQVQDQIEEKPYPKCSICYEYLDNEDGPGPSEKCQENCNDVVNVCVNNHLFHRGCILNSCNAGGVDIAAQMGSRFQYIQEQSIATECPLCKSPLIPSCEGLRVKERVPTKNINEFIKGGKRKRKTKKLMKKGKNKKSMKKGKKKKSMKKGKNKKLMKRRKTIKKRK